MVTDSWRLDEPDDLVRRKWHKRDGLESGSEAAALDVRRRSRDVGIGGIDGARPFGRRTSELGDFFGIFETGRLMAMAGQRLHLPGLAEVSAVCTHPDARGRGYARALMLEVMAGILRKGEAPFLHVFADHHTAIRVYEGLGFIRRRSLHLAALKSM